MDIAEFAERFLGVELQEWQKENIRELYSLSKQGNIRVSMRLPGEFYIYLDEKAKRELTQNGKTPNCYH